MRTIKQKHSRGCGVAALAMIAGVTYFEAFDAFTEKVRSNILADKRGTTTKDLVNAAAKFGIALDARRRPTHWGKPLPAGHAILSVNVEPNGNWHWVAWDGKRILDPAKVKGIPSVSSYVRVL